MNKVFKVIWSEARNAYVVVSEIAKNHGSKSCSTKKLLTMLIATGVMTCASMAPAMAATNVDSNANVTVKKGATVTVAENATVTVGDNAIVLGKGASAVKDSVAIGSGASVVAGNNGSSGVALGNKAHAGYKGTSLGSSAISGREGTTLVGANTNSASLYTTVVGTDSVINSDGTSYTALGRSINVQGAAATVVGSKNTVDNKNGKVYSGVANNVMGSANTIEASNGVTIQGIGNKVTDAYKDMNISIWEAYTIGKGDYSALAKKKSGAVAIVGGANTVSKQTDSTVIGYDNKLTGDKEKGSQNVFMAGSHNTLTNVSNSLVMGDNNTLEGRKNVISLGNNNTVTANKAVAIGNGTTVEAEGGVAIGESSVAKGSHSTAIGNESNVDGDNGLAIGYKSKIIKGSVHEHGTSDATVVGNQSVIGTDSNLSTIIGANSDIDGQAYCSTIIGAKSSISWGASGSTAVGEGTKVYKAWGTALGSGSKVTNENGTALGTYSSVTVDDGVAIGAISRADRAAGELGYLADTDTTATDITWKANKGAVSVGSSAAKFTRQITNVAAGTYDTDAVNVAQLKKVNEEALKHSTVTNGDNITVTEDTNKDGGKEYKVALDKDIFLSGDNADAFVDISGSKGTIWASGSVAAGNVVMDGATATVSGLGNTTTAYDGFANGKGKAATEEQLKEVATEAGKHTTLSDGKNTTVEPTVTAGQTDYKVNVAGDLTDITSVANGGAKLALNGEVGYAGIVNGKGASVFMQADNTVINGVVGIDKNGKISGVANGEADKDAVNYGQLKDVKAEALKHTQVKAGTNVGIVPGETEDGTHVYTVNADGTTVSGDSNVVVTAGEKDANNVTNYGVKLNKDLKGIESVSNGSASLTMSSNPIFGATAKLTNGKASVELRDSTTIINGKVQVRQDGSIGGVTAGRVDNDAVNVSQLNKVSVEAGKHTTLSNGKNTKVEAAVKDGQTDYKVNVAGDLTDISSVANGDAKLALNGAAGTAGIVNGKGASVYMQGSTTVINQNVSIDKDGKISGVAAGTADKDAVNYGQLKNISAAATAAKTEIKGGTNIANVDQTTADDGHMVYTVNANGTTVSGDSNVVVTAGEKDANNVTNYGVKLNKDLKGIESVSNGSASLTMSSNPIFGATAKLTNGKASVELRDSTTIINGKVQVRQDGSIGGVTAGRVDNDAVNVSQLNKVSVEAGKHTTLSNGKNTKVEAAVKDGQTDYKVNVAGDLTDISSVANGDAKLALNGAAGTAGIVNGKGASVYMQDGYTVINSKVSFDQDGKISGVAAGVNNDDAVNVSQLKKVEEAAGNANKGWNLSTNGVATEATNVKPGDNVDFSGDKNISVSNDGTAVSVKLNKNLKDIETISNGGATLTLGAMGGMVAELANGQGASVKLFGDTTTINGKVNVYKDGRIAGVADGVNATDAVNVSQLQKAAAASAATVTDGVNTTVTTTTAEDGHVDYKVNLNKNLTGVESISNGGASLTMNGFATELANGQGASVKLFGDTTTINGKVNVYKDGRIAGVADGVNANDAVNVSQLQKAAAASATTVSDGVNTTVTATKAEDGHTDYKVNLNKDLVGIESISNGDAKLTLGGFATELANGQGASVKLFGDTTTINNAVTVYKDGRIAGVANGINDNDAVNVGQLNKVSEIANKGWNLATNGVATEATNVKPGDYVDFSGDKNISVSHDGTKVKVELNKDIDVNYVQTNALNSKYNLSVGTANENGTVPFFVNSNGAFYAANGKLVVDKDGKVTATAGEIGNVVLNNGVYTGHSALRDGELFVGDASGNYSQITTKGAKLGKVTIAEDGKISGVAAGEVSSTSTDAINGSQLHQTNENVAALDKRVTANEEAIDKNKNDIAANKAAIEKNANDIATNKAAIEKNANDIAANKANIEKNAADISKLDTRVTNVEALAKKHTTVTAGDNITVTEDTNTDGGKEYKVALSKDITVDSVKAGDTTITDKGLEIKDGPSVTKDGIYAGDKKITGVAKGEADTDAVNYGQLKDTNNHIDRVENQVVSNTNRINQLGNRVNKVGAGAAALAALHPMDFDPDDKLTFSAGYGNYGGENAAAIGAYYRPDEKVMFSVGGTVGNGENMVNAGVSFSLDRTNHVSNSRTAMAREILDLRAEVTELKAMVAKGGLGSIAEDKMKIFPDVAENHWAYEYVGKLAAAGIIEGYPDGNFSGDRMMSRYEFAAMLYRAMQKGAQLDSKIINEFAPEMGRIRVDRISGEDGDRDKIERVRVNAVKGERDHYGNKIAKAEAKAK